MQRSILGVVNIFISHLLKDKDSSSIVRSLYRSLPFFNWSATACAAFFAASGSPR